MSEYKLIDSNGKTIAMGERDLMERFLKHHVADGDYAIEGTGVDMTYYRIDGIVYPSGGTHYGKKMQPRSKEECVAFFGAVPVPPAEPKADKIA